VAEVDQVTTIIDEFLQLAQPCSSDFSPTRLNSLVSLLLPVLRAEALFHNKQIITQICPVPPAMLDGKEIRQLLLNLVRNGLEAMQAGGRVWIRTGADKETVWLQVQDEGKGISPEDLPKLGNTFFSTKLEGTGLGLPVCYRIAERHRARITVESSPAGTTFTVAFPIDPVTEDGEQMPRELQPAPEGVQK
jgi:signal transduction histidine kinase